MRTSSSAPKRKTRKFKSHRPWNNEEVKSVTTFFRVSIKKNIVPRKRECEECKTKYKDILEKANMDRY
ncbi:hypothetical protein NQ314_006587 [Rhamnusium bicolor]|uniref:Uncharacterized protein n=1 Tax=Rhamnusium bicolor TaxID=1586634 RepID=A0AAV8YZ47_9CUCU|nr:hypothetical protein NQ314_006587 [Rhamnusium bicolor]